MLRPLALTVLFLSAACSDPDANVIRGKGLKPAPLPPSAQAEIYRAMTGVAFDLNNAGLVFMAYPRMLPRLKDSDGEEVPAALLSAMRDKDVVKGTCTPTVVANRKTPRCESADAAGYIVRFTEVLAMPHDTVAAYMTVEKYDTPGTPSLEPIKFERVYKLVKKGEAWVVTDQGRIQAK